MRPMHACSHLVTARLALRQAARSRRPLGLSQSYRLAVEKLEDRTLLAGQTLATASPLVLQGLGEAFGPTRPAAMVAGDFNGDGVPDLAVANAGSNDVAILLGRGDGTFQQGVRYPAGNAPQSLVAGDFNGDGRLDLAVANENSDDVSILLGVGDGTFLPGKHFPVDGSPGFITAAHLTRDGKLDLVTANNGTSGGGSEVSVLLGRGDGTFAPPEKFRVGSGAAAMAVGDFNGDGIPDLAVTDSVFGAISILFGVGDGTFQPEQRISLPSASPYRSPRLIVAADVNHDGILDLAVSLNSGVALLFGQRGGTFRVPVFLPASDFVAFLVAGDFNGDGVPDLLYGTAGDGTLLFGGKNETFPKMDIPGIADGFAVTAAAADFNDDGRLDLAVASASDNVFVLEGLGDGRFVSPDSLPTIPRFTPLLSDFDGDGVTDAVLLTSSGNILFRKGRVQEAGTFDPPVVLNPDVPARDLALVSTPTGKLIAAVDAKDDSVSLFQYRANGGFLRVGSLITGLLPTRIASADLNGDGIPDLIVLNVGDGTVSRFLGTNTGRLVKQADLPAGGGASDIALGDVGEDGRTDIVVTNQQAGTVTVLRNQGNGVFVPGFPFPAGGGLPTGSVTEEKTTAIAAADFNHDGLLDVAAINAGANTLGLLLGDRDYGFLNPKIFATSGPPLAIQAADFNHDGIPDLAVLNATGVDIDLGDGRGGLRRLPPVDAGDQPAGLAVADVNGDGIPDLAISNPVGDLFIQLGNGDGTFRPFQPPFSSVVDRKVGLAAANLTGRPGDTTFVFANPSRDRVAVQSRLAGPLLTRDAGAGLSTPQAVVIADVNGDGIPDLIVANSGSNGVVVYPGLGHGAFAAGRAFFTGNNPVGITIGDVNGDGIPDLIVPDQGANNVAVLLGQGSGANWSLVSGPRLRTGIGPVAALIADVTGPNGVPDGIPDLVVTNSGSNSVSVLRGVGGGFFDDRNARILNVGSQPQQTLLGDFNGDGRPDLLTVNFGSSDLTLIADFEGSERTATLPSGGTNPVAALVVHGELLVVNNGDGGLALFAENSIGSGAVQTLSLADVPHPTAATLSDQGAVYVTEAGVEAAFQLDLSIESSSAASGVNQSSLGLGLVPGLEASGEIPSEGAETETVQVTAESPVLVLALLLAPQPGAEGFRGGTDDDVADGAANVPEPAADETFRLQFMLGLPDALESRPHQHRDRLGLPDAPPAPQTMAPNDGSVPEPAISGGTGVQICLATPTGLDSCATFPSPEPGALSRPGTPRQAAIPAGLVLLVGFCWLAELIPGRDQFSGAGRSAVAAGL